MSHVLNVQALFEPQYLSRPKPPKFRLSSLLFPSLPSPPPSTLPFYATNGETCASMSLKALVSSSGALATHLACEKFGETPENCPTACAFRDAGVDGLPATVRGDFAPADGIRKAGRWLSSCIARKGEDGAPVQRSSGSVTAGIACDSKLKCDGWRVASSSCGRGPHHSIPITLWAVGFTFFPPQVSGTQRVTSKKGYY